MSITHNAASITSPFSFIENYAADVAVSMVFGLGYYLFKALKKKPNDDETSWSDPKDALKSLKGKLEGALTRWQDAKTVEEYHALIQTDYDGLSDPFKIIDLMNSRGLLPTIETYNALLLNCLTKNNEEFAKLLKEEMLDPMGPVTPNVYTLNILIKGLHFTFQNSQTNNKSKNETFSNFDDELRKLIESFEIRNVYLDVYSQNAILDALIQQSRLEAAWTHFTNMKKFRIFKPDVHTYTTLLKGIKQSENLSEEWLRRAFEIIDETKNLHEDSDESFSNSLLESCVKFNRIDKAESLFNEMITKRGGASEYAYTIMIRGYAKAFKMQKATEMFNKIKEMKATNTKESNYNPSEMKTNNADLDIINDTETRNMQFHIPTPSENSSNFSRSEVKKEISPSEIVNNNHTPTFAQCNTKFKDSSNSNEHLPNTETYAAILNAAVRCKDTHFAESLIEEMTRNKVQKSLTIFSTMISLYKKTRNFPKALELYDYLITKMKEDTNEDYRDYTLNNSFFHAVLECCVESGNSDRLDSIFLSMKNDFGLTPDVVTFSILLGGLAKANRINRVKEVYAEVRTNFQLDEVVYNSLLECFSKHDDEASVGKVCSDMKNNKVKMSEFSYGAVIKLYCNLGNSTKAFETFDCLVKDGCTPSVNVYTALIRLQLKFNFVDRAVTLFRNMLVNKVKPDVTIYELIINATFQHDRIKEAAEFVLNAAKEGVDVPDSIYLDLINTGDRDVSSDWAKNLLKFGEEKQLKVERNVLFKLRNLANPRGGFNNNLNNYESNYISYSNEEWSNSNTNYEMPHTSRRYSDHSVSNFHPRKSININSHRQNYNYSSTRHYNNAIQEETSIYEIAAKNSQKINSYMLHNSDLLINQNENFYSPTCTTSYSGGFNSYKNYANRNYSYNSSSKERYNNIKNYGRPNIQNSIYEEKSIYS